MHNAVQQWRNVTAIRQKYTTADRFMRREKLFSALQRWVAQLRRTRILNQQAATLSEQNSLHRLRSFFLRWQDHHRSAFYIKFSEIQLLHASWQKWWTKFTERTIRLKSTF